jgi:hypothetical protein
MKTPPTPPPPHQGYNFVLHFQTKTRMHVGWPWKYTKHSPGRYYNRTDVELSRSEIPDKNCVDVNVVLINPLKTKRISFI